MIALRTRIGRLERMTRPVPQGRWQPADFLAEFERLGQEGFFDQEPDYETTIALFRAEVAADDPDCPSLFWLGAMHQRCRQGRPPLSEEEYGRLARWYACHVKEHRAELYEINLNLFVGDGDARMARHPDVTAVAERLRRLMARYPEYE
jgi:hypothetical protein